MAEPFIFIGTHKLKEGKLEAAKRMCTWLADFVEANEPRMIAFNGYVNADGTEVSIVQVHPDAASMLTHMELLRQHITDSYQDEGPLDVTTIIQLFGEPGDTVLEMIEQFNPDVSLVVKPHGLAGFTRPMPEHVSAPS